MTCFNENDLNWKSGDTEYVILNYLADGEPVDLTGATGLMQLRKKPTSATATLSLDATIEITEGKLTFKAEASQTELLTTNLSTTYYYDAQVTMGSGDVKTLVSGKIVVSLDISR